ncbi:Transglutaminase-like superfamily protein [Frankineae bacterium MT45]|nr:Transglutaminase-like superfamily protein [Frankineae bacterium MT45]
MIRRLIPLLIFPLAVLANGFASSPWLRAFPAATLALPLFGAALISVLLPLVTARLGATLVVGIIVDVIAFLLYSLVAVLGEPFGFGDLVDGLVHGPSQLLTFALPLVSPPTLMIAPIGICWLAGAISGEVLSRRPISLVPNAGWLLAFVASYAATERATGIDLSAARIVEAELAAGLLVTMALLRLVQVWLRGAVGRDATEGEGELPVRPMLIGLVSAVVVALLAASVVQADLFGGVPAAPERVPAVNQAAPVTPLAFVSALRPAVGAPVGAPLFTVATDRASNGYFALASVDLYDGDSWSFNRTFRPSGGVIPADLDPSLSPKDQLITQVYRVTSPTLIASPWMPYLNRPVTVADLGINVDSVSGMIVPANGLRSDASYQVSSLADAQTLTELPTSSALEVGGAPINTQLPPSIRATMTKVVDSFSNETGKSATGSVEFLQALAADLRNNYGLSGGPSTDSSGSATDGVPVSGTHTGGTNFSDVVASIIGPQRSGTPEQFATLFALVARQLGVPARVVTGFRVQPKGSDVPAGTYSVTAAQATTWVEVPVQGLGWVPVDAVPASYLNQQQSRGIGAAVPTPIATAPPSQNALVDTSNGGHAVAKKSAVPGSGGSSWLQTTVLVVILVLLVAAIVVSLLLLRKRRRRQRRSQLADPRQRLIGAWAESLDLLAESGLSDLSHLTGREVAARTSQEFGDESGGQVATLARSADRAIYSPRSAISDELADDAWDTQLALARSLHDQLGRRARLVAMLRHSTVSSPDPGPQGPDSWQRPPLDGEAGAGSGWLAGLRGFFGGDRRRH